jgi:hypothetical protein
VRRIHQLIATATLFTLFALSGAFAQDTRVVKIDVVDQAATGADVEISGGTGVVRVTQGEEIEIHWTSNQATELHLHGYNVKTKVAGEGEAIMTVKARTAGRFAVESHGFGADHHAEKTLLYLEVLPR